MKPNKDNKIILSEKTQREMLEFFMETSIITKLKKASIQNKKRIGESNERIKRIILRLESIFVYQHKNK